MGTAQPREVTDAAKSQPENVKTPWAHVSHGPFCNILDLPDSLRTLW